MHSIKGLKKDAITLWKITCLTIEFMADVLGVKNVGYPVSFVN